MPWKWRSRLRSDHQSDGRGQTVAIRPIAASRSVSAFDQEYLLVRGRLARVKFTRLEGHRLSGISLNVQLQRQTLMNGPGDWIAGQSDEDWAAKLTCTAYDQVI